MLVLYWVSTIVMAAGRSLAFPIGVEDADLDAFCARLVREGGVMVSRLHTEARADGYHYIVGEERTFVSLAGTATVQNNRFPVRREED